MTRDAKICKRCANTGHPNLARSNPIHGLLLLSQNFPRLHLWSPCVKLDASLAAASQQVGRTRRWGVKSLQKQQQQQQLAGRAPPGNAFPTVALQWAAGLLRDCDVERHGVDLFNRDPLLLGRLLITLVRKLAAGWLCSCSRYCRRWLCCYIG